LKKEGSKTATM